MGNSRKTTVFIFPNQVGFEVLCEYFYTFLPRTYDTFVRTGQESRLVCYQKNPSLDPPVLQRFVFWMGAPS